MSTSSQSLGGKARGKIQRELALKRYYENPIHCLHCKKVIRIHDHQKVKNVRRKKFCNSSCAASFNNKLRKVAVKVFRCPDCSEVKSQYSNRCVNCSHKNKRKIMNLTFGELLESSPNYQTARSQISRWARLVYRRKSVGVEQCRICRYTHRLNVCHIKAVKDFPSTALISEINDISNLVLLCPNHHAEYDDGLLEIIAR